MQWARKAGSSASACMPAAMAPTSRGSTSNAAPPLTSGRELVLEVSTGTPAPMASMTGMPKPSYREGNTNTPAPAYRWRSAVCSVRFCSHTIFSPRSRAAFRRWLVACALQPGAPTTTSWRAARVAGGSWCQASITQSVAGQGRLHGGGIGRRQPGFIDAVVNHADALGVDAETAHQLVDGEVGNGDDVIGFAGRRLLQPVFGAPPAGIAPLGVTDRQGVVQGRHLRAIHAHQAVVGRVKNIHRHMHAVGGGGEQVAQGGGLKRLRQGLADADGARVGAPAGIGKWGDGAARLRQLTLQGRRVDADAVEPSAI